MSTGTQNGDSAHGCGDSIVVEEHFRLVRGVDDRIPGGMNCRHVVGVDHCVLHGVDLGFVAGVDGRVVVAGDPAIIESVHCGICVGVEFSKAGDLNY